MSCLPVPLDPDYPVLCKSAPGHASCLTYIHIPGEGWWYAVTVIDYYSRYLLAVHFTPSYAALDINEGIDKARGIRPTAAILPRRFLLRQPDRVSVGGRLAHWLALRSAP